MMLTSDMEWQHRIASTECCKLLVLGKNKGMDHRDKIQVELIKLVGGERLMRLTYSPLRLVLEKQLDSTQAVARQKERLFAVFGAALAQAELTAA